MEKTDKSNQRSAISAQPNEKLKADKLNADRSGSKDPAAVALGKRRIAKMTPEEKRAFHAAGTAALRRRSPLERRLTAQRSVLTRRMRAKWMAQSGQHSAVSGQPSAGSPPAPPPEISELARLLDEASDEALARLRSTLAR